MSLPPQNHQETLAFDRESVRSVGANGALHVQKSNISIAAVNPYLGREIPGYQSLGLDADRIYNMLRDPDELRKSAPTFQRLELLEVHKPTSANDIQQRHLIGTVGSDVVFDGTHLHADLTIWDGDAIKGIETEEKRELSCSYSYDADMTPGTYKGQSYDGVMRNIKGNHVALVSTGRAGRTVVVSDSLPPQLQPKGKPMTKREKIKAAFLAYDEAKTPEEKDKEIDKIIGVKDEDDEDEEAKKKADEDAKKKKAEDDEGEEDEEAKKKAEKDDAKTKAMDSAINAAVEKRVASFIASSKASTEAKAAVRPFVGTLAMDDAGEIYSYALNQVGLVCDADMDVKSKALAWRAYMAGTPKVNTSSYPALANDSSTGSKLATMLPNISRISHG